jgi:glutamate N-acetyltransferase/amino-acid N-acetyltransferase
MNLWLLYFLLYDAGVPVPFDKQAVSAYLKNNRDIVMVLRFRLGKGQCTFWTCDLTYDYVRLNADYTT